MCPTLLGEAGSTPSAHRERPEEQRPMTAAGHENHLGRDAVPQIEVSKHDFRPRCLARSAHVETRQSDAGLNHADAAHPA